MNPDADEHSDGPNADGYENYVGHHEFGHRHRDRDTYEHEVLFEHEHLFHPLPHLALHASFSFRRLGSANNDDESDGETANVDDDDYFPNHEYYDSLPTETYWQRINSTSIATNLHGTLSDFGLNETEYDDFTTHLNPASDVDLEGVIAATAFNALVFAVLMISYEIMRKLVPSVYASKRQQAIMRGEEPSQEDETYSPFDWLMPVFGVSWSKVRRAGGLDAYFFLRYIRMCLRITSVSAFWAIIILWPVFGSGGGQYGTWSWYHFSMANIDQGSWRIWIPTIFIYLFSTYIFYCLKQEYKHYVELRMEYLGRGPTANGKRRKSFHSIDQAPYSVMVERLPKDLRSDKALYDYFNRLFPGNVHSACVVLNVPDLEVTARKTQRAVRRLEKSIASYIATGRRPSHIAGRPRINLLGVDCSPLEVPVGRRCHEPFDVEGEEGLPPRGVVVDSIAYYTQELVQLNRALYLGQRNKVSIAEEGNTSVRANYWIAKAADYARAIGDTIITESIEANSLTVAPSGSNNADGDTPVAAGTSADAADRSNSFSSRYGSFDDESRALPRAWSSDDDDDSIVLGGINWNARTATWEEEEDTNGENGDNAPAKNTDPNAQLLYCGPFEIPAELQEKTFWRRLAGRLGLDYFVALIRYIEKRVRVYFVEIPMDGTTMSSTGFVTFFTHETTTIASSAQLTHKPNALQTVIAPEPRDIIWDNAHIHKQTRLRKEITANIVLGFGIIFWSIPLAAIQAFAKVEQIARIPGCEWIGQWTAQNPTRALFINGYLPVVFLLALISALPFVFEAIGKKYENRKTMSGVQQSIVGRYFYYQIANIYVSVTAGSIWKAAADIIDRPAEVLEILGESIPMMVGYFMSLLITKILAGLPMLILRMGALSRLSLLRLCFSTKKLTQRELDEVYRKETVFYGWEYPTQLLVIMIAFAYACISPVILIVSAMYFLGALIVYKKQVLYVYTPTYESGGKLFPVVCDRTLFGLIISQLTFIGYSLIRKGKWQPLFLAPLPCITLYMMYYFRFYYAEPSLKLSLERAIELDHHLDTKVSGGSDEKYTPSASKKPLETTFKKDFYRQPVLAATIGRPLEYRRTEGVDEATAVALEELDEGTSRYQRMTSAAGDADVTAKDSNSDSDIRALADTYSLEATSSEYETPKKKAGIEQREIV